ncbi:MAG TPA: rhamnogalacturonan acetylesterase [Isosphaeraceae bacterium]
MPPSRTAVRPRTPILAGLGLVAALGLLAGTPAARAAGDDPPAPAAQRLPTLFLIGDSTVKNSTRGLQGWGDRLASEFDPAQIRVENRALGGRSSRSYRTEGLWDRVAAELRPGDFVLVQFGHNDGGPLDRGRARASLKGTGEQTREIVNEATGRAEVVHTYGWYLRQYIAEARARGATPIVLSPVPRNIWTADGTVARASHDYGQWAAEVAKAEGVPFIDLNDRIARRYEQEGRHKVATEYFTEDHTHTTPAGARLNAAIVAEGIRGLVDSPLRAYLAPASRPEDTPESRDGRAAQGRT